MNRKTIVWAAAAWLTGILCLSACSGGAVEWSVRKHPMVLKCFGDPQPVTTDRGEAVRFDGEDDGLFVEGVPVAGLKEFTLEMVFRQEPSEHFEQRFLHMGEFAGNRIMFESRVNPDSTWYFDAYVHQGDPEHNVVLIDPARTHPCGQWYTLTLVASEKGMTTYVNGEEQCHSDVPYIGTVGEGLTSIGVRQNLVCWFNGDILSLRVTPRAEVPARGGGPTRITGLEI